LATIKIAGFLIFLEAVVRGISRLSSFLQRWPGYFHRLTQEWWLGVRRSTAAMAVMGSLKMLSHSENGKLLVITAACP
jgi:hypothetical protein